MAEVSHLQLWATRQPPHYETADRLNYNGYLLGRVMISPLQLDLDQAVG